MYKVIFLFLIFSTYFLRAQSQMNIVSLRGFEDNKGNTQLILKVGASDSLSEHNILKSGALVFNAESSLVEKVFPSSFYVTDDFNWRYKLYHDFIYDEESDELWTVGMTRNFNSSSFGTFFQKNENNIGSLGEGWQYSHPVRIYKSPKSPFTLYVTNGFFSYVSNNEGNNWHNQLNYKIVSPDLINPDCLFITNSDSLLLHKNSFEEVILDTNKIWFDYSNFIFDADSNHFYAYTTGINDDSPTNLFLGEYSKNGITLKKIMFADKKFFFTTNYVVSGEVYIAFDNIIYKSIEMGNIFQPFFTCDSRITGLYKKPGGNKLFFSTYKSIFKCENQTAQKIYDLPVLNVSTLYPLDIGDLWVYQFGGTYYDTFPHPFGGWVRTEVVGVETKENGKEYFVINRNSIYYEKVTPIIYYQRFDNSTNQVLEFDKNEENMEYVLYDLNMGINYQGTNDYHPVPTDITLDDLFGRLVHRKSFMRYGADADDLDLVENLGFYRSYSEFDFGTSSTILKGALINGILYGDTTIVVGVRDNFSNSIPTNYFLSQNYPNPFNPSTKIKFTIPLLSPFNKGGNDFSRGGFVTLIIYDILGREITTLVNEYKSPGTYEVEFDGANLPSGVYFYQLKCGNFTETKKLVLIK
ncbi:MAG: T9SS type A sorting domain-containing protein [bacterium]